MSGATQTEDEMRAETATVATEATDDRATTTAQTDGAQTRAPLAHAPQTAATDAVRARRAPTATGIPTANASADRGTQIAPKSLRKLLLQLQRHHLSP